MSLSQFPQDRLSIWRRIAARVHEGGVKPGDGPYRVAWLEGGWRCVLDQVLCDLGYWRLKLFSPAKAREETDRDTRDFLEVQLLYCRELHRAGLSEALIIERACVSPEFVRWVSSEEADEFLRAVSQERTAEGTP
jgi:hypothetical protein